VELRNARLDELELELTEPFETSFGVEKKRRFLLVRLESKDGLVGYGECVAATEPLYSSETVDSAREMLSTRFLPEALQMSETSPAAFLALTRRYRGQRMAKAAVETALVDLAARADGRSVSRWLGGRRRRVEVGVSVGIQPTVGALVRRVRGYLEDGYRRVKLKVRPGWDVAPVRAVRRAFPEIEIWVDANQAYPTNAADRIRGWAEANRVAQVEQPFPERAIRAHARLARGARFRVCLDESIVDAVSLEDALGDDALTSLNLKTGRVGGLTVARDLARRATRAGVPSWVGGMLESGIGRAHNVHLASLDSFTLPADLSASNRYYCDDLIEPPFVLGPGSTLEVPQGPGIGVEILDSAIRRARRSSRTIHR
jgi:o-succinylbenzoate synthase